MYSEKLLDQIAEVSHNQFKGWVNQVLNSVKESDSGEMVIDRAIFDDWVRMSKTDFSQLGGIELEQERSAAAYFLKQLYSSEFWFIQDTWKEAAHIVMCYVHPEMRAYSRDINHGDPKRIFFEQIKKDILLEMKIKGGVKVGSD